ncbi:MAG: hypothetical protein LBT59_24355, partial [Clostridiales bacterium]|nr:hypothetical protein [Clostridiales bacterium]
FTTVNLKLSSGAKLPDIMLFGYNLEIANTFVGADRIMKLNDVFESSKLKNIPAIDSRVKDYIRDSSGNMWYIPGWYAMEYDEPWGGWTVDAWYARTDLMEKAGITKADLATIDGLENALREFAKLKDDNGNAIIPLSFPLAKDQERAILATFGVDMAKGSNNMPAVMEKNGEFVFSYDNPDFKKAYQWMNKMYREGLIDMEVTTMQQERFNEKIKTGQVAMFTTDIWTSNCFSNAYADDSPSFKFDAIQSPTVPGTAKGYTSLVDPNPQHMVFINKDTKSLNAVLKFLEWANEPEPIRQHEMNEGPIGTTWHFTDGEYWSFEKEYGELRDSGDGQLVDSCTPQLYMFTSYSNKWYPWFMKDRNEVPMGDLLVQKYCQVVGNEIVNHRAITNKDKVKIEADSVVGENIESLDAVVDEYAAKMIMAESDEKFESYYSEFFKQMDLRASWDEMKATWLEAYNAQYGA